MPQTKQEVAAYYRAYRKAHQSEYAERTRRRDALKLSATIGPIDIEAIKVRDRMRCAICGKKVAEKELSFDHTIPLSLGGPHSQENLRVAHRRCNSRRGAGRLPVQMVLCQTARGSTPGMVIETAHKLCLRCGKIWVPLMEAPKQCPRCKSYRWDVPRAAPR